MKDGMYGAIILGFMICQGTYEAAEHMQRQMLELKRSCGAPGTFEVSFI